MAVTSEESSTTTTSSVSIVNLTAAGILMSLMHAVVSSSSVDSGSSCEVSSYQ